MKEQAKSTYKAKEKTWIEKKVEAFGALFKSKSIL